MTSGRLFCNNKEAIENSTKFEQTGHLHAKRMFRRISYESVSSSPENSMMLLTKCGLLFEKKGVCFRTTSKISDFT